MSDDMKVTVSDIRAAGYCVPGLRRRCRDLGLDMRRLISGDISVSEVEGIEDTAVRRVIAIAKSRSVANGQQ